MALAILNHTSNSVETEPQKPRDPPAKPSVNGPDSPSLSRWNKRDTLLLVLILLLAGGLRILRLAEPNAVVFDETYYAKDACLYLGHSQGFCKVDQATEQSYVHPPLGKWLISLGINAFGYNSFGWRFSAAVFGTAMAGVAYLFARRLFKNRWTAGVAGLLTAVDLLLIVQSRIAMLDIFLAFFLLLGFLFLAMDRERARNLQQHLASSSGPSAMPEASGTGEGARMPGTNPEQQSPRETKTRTASERGRPAGGPKTAPEPAESGALLKDPTAPAESLSALRADSAPVTISLPALKPVQPSRLKRLTSFLRPGRASSQDDLSARRHVAREGDVPARGVLWRFAAGAAFGLALAVKWSAFLALGAAAVCAFFWSLELLVLSRRNRSSFYGPLRTASLARELMISFSAFALIPAFVYLASYGAYFVDRQREDCPYTVPSGRERLFDSRLLNQPEGKCITGIAGTALSFADLQDRIFDYHSTLTAKHSYQSKAWTWPLVLRPVAYFYESEDGKATEVMALGNVAVWYGALLALFWLVPRSLRSWRAERIVLLAWGAQYLPWLLVPRPLFLFYMTPVVPFMMLGLASALNALRQRWPFGRGIAIFYLIIAAGVMTILFYPVVAGVALPQDWWQRLMWIRQFDCGGLMCGWI